MQIRKHEGNIEAVRVTVKDLIECAQWAHGQPHQDTSCIVVKTQTGRVAARVGNWIVKDAGGVRVLTDYMYRKTY